MIGNYHTHTRWCNHGTGEIEDYIKEAVRAGLGELAITEHVPLPGDFDPRRLTCAQFEAYNNELDEMIKKYQDVIRVRKGFECEYYPDFFEHFANYRDNFGYEILILGHHTSKDRSVDSFSVSKPAEVIRYANEVCEGLETGFYTFLAHPDVILNAYPAELDKPALDAMRQIFTLCEEKNIPVEINANGYNYKRGYPNWRVWEAAAAFPNLICIVGADAHTVPDLTCPAVDECKNKARELGLNLIEKLD